MSVYRELSDYTGASYLRYSFTKGTEQEVGFLFDALGLAPGMRVLDAGCGPGRHSLALARRGIHVVGVDLALSFLEVARDAGGSTGAAGPAPVPIDAAPGPAPTGAAFVQGDVRRLPVRPGSFDAVICLCQGGFGLLGGAEDEGAALRELARALRPGGRLALTAFSSWYAVRWLAEGESFDAGTGVLLETARVRDRTGEREAEFALEHTCFTPRELRLMAAAAGVRVEALWSVEPGRYEARAPEVDRPEWLMVAVVT
ncbi:MAG TPA: class I SAM-dependent methyltransferase [Acidimicrobiales bacterium]|nr:class I SAM-dependent methyltransferase [Acidimicrobiales bacterium]